MKRFFAVLLLFSAVLALCTACQEVDKGKKTESSFTATILSITDDTVLAEVAEGDALRESAEQVSFSTQALEPIDAKVGDTVTVIYSGDVVETAPAQVLAISWSLTESK